LPRVAIESSFSAGGLVRNSLRDLFSQQILPNVDPLAELLRVTLNVTINCTVTAAANGRIALAAIKTLNFSWSYWFC
jgi:hypothetical protein